MDPVKLTDKTSQNEDECDEISTLPHTSGAENEAHLCLDKLTFSDDLTVYAENNQGKVANISKSCISQISPITTGDTSPRDTVESENHHGSTSFNDISCALQGKGEKSFLEMGNDERKPASQLEESDSCIVIPTIAGENLMLSEKNTESKGSDGPPPRCVLKEHSSPDNILSLIPLKLQQGFRTVNVGITCFDADGAQLFFGSNAGCGFLYYRETGDILKLLSESRSDVVTAVKLFAGIECQAALGTRDGKLTIFILSTSMATSTRQVQKFPLGKVHEAEITCLEWSTNGMKLFSGDDKGNIYVVERDFEKDKCNVSHVITESNAIVDLSYRHMVLLVSTMERTVIFHSNVKEGSLKPVGSKTRHGSFGACFNPNSVTSNDLHVFCSRPGYRIWIADIEGKVTNTLLLKDLASAAHPSIEMETPSSEVCKKDSQFGKLLFYRDKYLLSYSETSLFLIDPSKPSVIASNQELPGILGVTTTAEEIFVLQKDRQFRRISGNPDNIAIKRRRLEEEKKKESLNLQNMRDSLSEVKRNLTPIVGALQSTISSFNERGGQWSQRIQSQAKVLQQKFPIKSSPFTREDTNIIPCKPPTSVPPNVQSSLTQPEDNKDSLGASCRESPDHRLSKSPVNLKTLSATSCSEMENTDIDLDNYQTEKSIPGATEQAFLRSQDHPELMADDGEKGQSASVNSHFEKLEKIAAEENSEIVFVSKRKKIKPRQVSSTKRASSPKVLKQSFPVQLDKSLTRTDVGHDIHNNDLTGEVKVESSGLQGQPELICPNSPNHIFHDPESLNTTFSDPELPHPTCSHVTLEDSKPPPVASKSSHPICPGVLLDDPESPNELESHLLTARPKQHSTTESQAHTDGISPIPQNSPPSVSIRNPLFSDFEDDENLVRFNSSKVSSSDDIYTVDDGKRDFGSETMTESDASEDEGTPIRSNPVLLNSSQSFTDDFDDFSTSIPAKLRDSWSTTALPHQVASISGSDSYIWYIDYFNQVRIAEECGASVAGIRWKKLAKKGVKLCISLSGAVAWLVTKNGKAYAAAMPVSFHLLDEPVELNWQLVANKVSLAALGNDSAWVVSSSGIIKAQFGISRSNTFSKTWNLITWNKEKITDIIATKSTVWCRTDQGDLFAADIASIDAPGFKWERVELPPHKGTNPSSVQSITSDSRGVLFAVDSHGILWFLTEERQWWQVNVSEYIDESNHLFPHSLVQSLPLPASVTTSVHKVQRWMAGLVRAQHIAVNNQSIWIVHDKWKASVARGPITGSRWDITNPLGVVKSSKWKCITTSSVFSSNHGSWLGLVWASRPNGEIFCFPSEDVATFHPITLEPPVFDKASIVCMSACKEALWLLYDDGSIYIRSGISAECLGGTKWNKLDTRDQLGNVKIVHVSCGTQNVWAVDMTGCLYFRIGVTAVDRNSLPAAWIPIDGCPISGHFFTQIECGLSDASIWALDNFSEVYVRTGVSVKMPVGDGWEVVPGSHAQQVFISNHTVWGLRIGGNLLKRFGISERNQMGDYWKKMRGHFKKLAATPYDELWAIDQEEHMRHLRAAVYCPIVVEAQYKFNSSINTDDYSLSNVESGWEFL